MLNDDIVLTLWNLTPDLQIRDCNSAPSGPISCEVEGTFIGLLRSRRPLLKQVSFGKYSVIA